MVAAAKAARAQAAAEAARLRRDVMGAVMAIARLGKDPARRAEAARRHRQGPSQPDRGRHDDRREAVCAAFQLQPSSRPRAPAGAGTARAGQDGQDLPRRQKARADPPRPADHRAKGIRFVASIGIPGFRAASGGNVGASPARARCSTAGEFDVAHLFFSSKFKSVIAQDPDRAAAHPGPPRREKRHPARPPITI